MHYHVGVDTAVGGCRGLSGVCAAVTLLLPDELRSGLNLSCLILVLGVIAAAKFLNGEAPAEF